MATVPTPFFPTTVVPPPPCGCGVPPYTPCCFSSAVAYPPPSFSGGYYTSPFPYFYDAPPPFPYPPAASAAYTPASGFSPNWPPSAPHQAPSTTPSTFPYDSSCQTREASQIPTQVDPIQEMGKDMAPESTPSPRAATRGTVDPASSPPKEVGKYTA